VCGHARAGKDTFGRLLENAIRGIARGGNREAPSFVRRVSIAMPLKQMYCLQNNLTPAELEQTKEDHRPGLIAMGARSKELLGQDVFTRAAFTQAGHTRYAIVTDLRFEHELDFVRSLRKPLLIVWIDSEEQKRNPIKCGNEITRCKADVIVHRAYSTREDDEYHKYVAESIASEIGRY